MALHKGSLYAGLFLLLGVVLIPLASLTFDLPAFVFIPAVTFAAALMLFVFLIYLITFRPDFSTTGLYIILILSASLPSAYFFIIEQLVPGAAAAFMLGPLIMAYAPMLLITGFTFNFRVSIAAGLVASVSLLLAYVLIARDDFLRISAPHAIITAILVNFAPNIMKSVILFFTGCFVGYIGYYTRQVFTRLLQTEIEREQIKRTFGEFVSDEIREKILERNIRSGERARAVILFADIRGFTGISERLAPEDLVGILNRYFDEMVRAIESSGGVIDKFIGDAIMAQFGGVFPLRQPCLAAITAARHMQQRLVGFNAMLRAESLPEIRIGIGIHYSEVIQGVIGSENRKEFTAIGDGVNVAARLESHTREVSFAIICSEAVKTAMENEQAKNSARQSEAQLKSQLQSHASDTMPVLHAIGSVSVKGRSEPLDIYGIE